MTDSEKSNMIPAVEFTTAKKSRTAQLSQLTKIYKTIERQMISAEDSEHVKTLFNKLCERFEQFKVAHLQCLDLCDDSESVDTLEASFVSQQKNLEEFRERYEEWQAQNEKGNDHMDNISVISGTSSVRSTRTQLLSAKAKRLVAENKLKKLAKKHEFELARRELEQQQEMYDHQCDLEEAEIEESVWQEALEDTIPHLSHNDDARRIEHSESESTSGSLHGSSDSQLKENRNTVSVFSRNNPDTNCLHSQNSPKYCDNHSSNTNAHRGSVVDSGSRLSGESATSGDNERREDGSLRRAQITTSSNSHDNILTNTSGSVRDNTIGMETAFQRLAETLQEGFNLPKPELLTFNGSPADYCKFIKNFETNIECKISDDRLRLSYLIQYCQGEARYSIEDCVLLEPSAGYNRARDILLSRYGRPHVIARSYVEKLVYGPPIAASDTDNLSKLCLEMQKCEITLSQLGFTTDVDNSENLRRIVRRLPMHMRTKWADIAHGIIESGREPRFHDVVKFVDERSRVASSMYGVDLIKDNGNKRISQGNANTSEYRGKITTLSLNTDGNSHIYESKCICCSGSCSDLASCDEFTSMSLNDRINFIRKLKLCFNCLKPNHLSYNCRKPNACTVSDCKMKHNTSLHSWVKVESDHTVTQPAVNCAATTGPVRKTCLGIIPVTVRGRNGNYYKTYALLDDGADKTLCDERLLKILEVETKPVTFKISTVNSTGSETVGREVDLYVQHIDGDNEVQLRSVWSVKKLPISTRSAASNVDISKITYLRNIQIPEVTSSDVMLLIGTDAPEAHIPLEVRSGDSDQPYAIKSRLGWAIRGPVPSVDTKTCDVNINFGVTNDIILQQQFERTWTSGFGDTKFPEKECMFVEEIKIAQNTTVSRAQVTYLSDEMESILNKKPVKMSSRLASFNLNIEDGLIRMNGRQQNKTLPLPDGHYVSTVTTRHIHETKGNMGQQVLPQLRRNYRIIRGLSPVKKILNKCMLCKRQNAPFLRQQMTPMITEQTTPENPYFIYTDGDKELRRSIKEWKQSEIGRYMIKQEIDWKFNPPTASHMGGTWERLLRSTRRILTALVQKQLLSDEQLVTLMTEFEKIPNDRPITTVSTDPRDPPALTPSMLLLMKSNQYLPIGVFQKHDNYAIRWWRQVRYIADIILKRWLHEYLPALQVRYKWQRKTTNLRKGDLVLIVTENTPRGQWPLARVIEVNVGRDGHVRSCVVRSRGSESVRPITKLCLLESD